VGNLLQDLRFSLRVLIKNPGFTLVAVIALALGIGANTAIFSVIDSVLLRPLPYGDPDRLVRVSQVIAGEGEGGRGGGGGGPTSPANFVDWQNQNQVFEDMTAFNLVAFNLIGRDEPERVLGVRTTPNLFDVLQVKPLLGRTFQPDDAMPDAEPVLVMSQGYFESHFGADPKALGSTLNLDGVLFRLVGVMPAGFEFGQAAQFWVPLIFTPQDLSERGLVYLSVIARLADGVSIEQARSGMSNVAGSIQQEFPTGGAAWSVGVVNLKDQFVGDFKGTLFILLGAVCFVLLVACANVANLLLARAAERVREIAIRTALGASRARLIRQMLTESVLLGLLGGGLGLLLAFWCVSLLRRVNPGNIPRLDEIGIDARVLGFTVAVSLVTGLIFGLLPALQISRKELYGPLKDGGAQLSAAQSRQRLRNLLVISEVALALVLLIGAGLMIRSFQLLLAVDPGFDPKNVLTLRMSLPLRKYPEPHQRLAFLREVLDRVADLPGVKSAGLVTTLPLEGGELREMVLLDGRPLPQGEPPAGGLDIVSPDYFATLGIQIVNGRPFTPFDREDSPPVVIIDETMARRFYPGENPVGKRLMIPGVKPVFREIVGVARGLKFFGLEQERRPTLYVPLLQHAGERSMGLAVKTRTDPLQLAGAVRSVIWSIDRDQTVSTATSMEQLLDKSVAQRRFNTGMIEVFALLALVLAVVGIHGVLAYSVTQRTREIGVRMALGADKDRVLRSVLGQALGMVGIGVALGIAGSIALTRLMASLLYGVSAMDPGTYVGMSVLLIAVALLAAYFPARRATRVNPLVALRYD
jgi:putative ABC transport system permease protein